ncbi:MAG: phage tail sheath subtilisin-like domain-containing protein [Proteobacteria bacterium]|nr:phage tail sheath subtilisin-like domain-containing protein [Pseudomonadota bacterium]
MPTYRTPDVYVEEISVFPPSVAEVETAVPAFVGYTAMAARITAGDLKNVPTRITSLLEFETLFGGAPELDLDHVDLDAGNRFLSATLAATNTKYLYDSLRLFFDNGGGPAWICSVGKHTDAVDKTQLIAGLARIATVDEPTILLFPDAAGLGADDLAAVQMAALNQCGKLGDRVSVLDTRLATDKTGHTAVVDELRNRIGINSLKYGAAYAPWLQLNYPKNVGYADIKSKLKKGGVAVMLNALTGDAGVLALLQGLDQALADLAGLPARRATVSGGTDKAISDTFGATLLAYLGTPDAAHMQDLFAFVYKIAPLVDGMASGAGAFTHAGLKGDAGRAITHSFIPAMSELIALERELDGKLTAAYVAQYSAIGALTTAGWATLFGADAPAASTTAISAAADDVGRLAAAQAAIQRIFGTLSSALANLDDAAAAYAANTEANLLDSFATYRDIVRGVNNTLTACPPSGAVAGIYALVDNQRGVWKAPANVSLTGVIAPTYALDSDDTDNLNVDATAGKSVNAIRSFVGKGTLIWGARTLAGNDNEWRYISVRRFFNMVEESVKKSTYWAVFEPNDANTWVKVRGMIESYLTQKWREGALAGSTTKDAFFVRCGLGTTMSSQDILEGRMYVEIGMAVVRPAEFIILKFYHKLQTS